MIGVIVALAGIGFAAGRLTAPAATAFGQGRGGQFTGNGQFNGQLPGAGQNGGTTGRPADAASSAAAVWR